MGEPLVRAKAPTVLIGLVALLLAAGAYLRVSANTGDDGSSDGSELVLHGTTLAQPWDRPDFTLSDTAGEPFDFAEETAGRLTLLFFGYTSCPDVCPIHLSTLASVLARPGMPEPLVVFVGIDPARDTAAAVRTYLDRFDTDFIGLVGTPEELEAAQRETGVAVAFAEPADAGGDYLVGHAAQIVAYTADDKAHVVYPFGVRQQDWTLDLPLLADSDLWIDERASG